MKEITYCNNWWRFTFLPFSLSQPFYGGRSIGVKSQENKTLNKAPGSGQKNGSSLLAFSTLPPSISSSKSESLSSGSNSAYGLSDITMNAMEASKAAARTLSTPTTPTSTKPKFQVILYLYFDKHLLYLKYSIWVQLMWL